MFARQQLFIVCLAVVTVDVLAGGPFTRLYGNKRHPTLDDHCYTEYGEHGVSVKLGESITPTDIPMECLRLSCDDEFVLRVETCPFTQMPCNGPHDYTKPHPECCECL